MTGVPAFMLSGGAPALEPVDGPAPHVDDAIAGEFIAAGDDTALPPPPPFVPGVFDGMPAETYHATEAMSSSGGKKIRQSPAHYKLARTTRNVSTPTMQFGTVVHAGVLEPNTFDRVVVAAPTFNRYTKAGKEAAAEFARAHAGRIVLSVDDLDRARRCIDAVLSHPAASQFLTGAVVERSLFWIDAKYNVPCKARWDAFAHNIIGDLKTTLDASPEAFGRACATYEYHAQAAHYCSAAEHLLNASPQAYLLIAVESVPPHAVAVYALPGGAIASGAHLCNIALARYREALDAGEWKGYPPTIETLTLPKWAMRFS